MTAGGPTQPPSRRVAEYLRKAEECERRASEVRDPEISRTLRALAAQWRSLAEQLQRHGL